MICARAASHNTSPLQTAFQMDDSDSEMRYRAQKNPIIPNVQRIAERWAKLDAGKQDDIIAYLEDKMRGDWHELTSDEKYACYYIYYGPWGPRGPQSDFGKIYGSFASVVAACVLIISTIQFYRRSKAGPQNADAPSGARGADA